MTSLRIPQAILMFALLAIFATPSYSQKPALKDQGMFSWSLLNSVHVHPEYRGQVPKKSDVVFSTRFKRGEASNVAKSFGATRVEWVYSNDGEFVSQLKRDIGWFGAALNSTLKLPSEAGMAKDFDGNTLVLSWMKAWGGQLNTTTHPDTQKALRAQAKMYLDMGADSIQFDDPGAQYYAGYYMGGDFNASTLAGFPKFLESYPDSAELERVGLAGFRGDYRDFLKKSFGVKDAKDYAHRKASIPTTGIWLKYLQKTVVDQMAGLRNYMEDVRGAAVPLSMNLYILDTPSEESRYFFLAGLADYAMVETPVGDSLEMQLRAATLRSLGVGFVPSIQPKTTADNRVAIATFYALGGNPIVPWDVYIGNDETGQPKRMFGTLEEYGDLYRFVRKYPALFDGREQAAVVGIPVPVNQYDEKATLALVGKLRQRYIPFAFVPVGGTHISLTLDVDRVEHFKLIVLVNGDDDFAASDLKVLRGLKVRRVRAAELSDAMLDDLVPAMAVGEAADLHLYPRAQTQPGMQEQLVIHLVDEARGAVPPSSGNCKRRIGLRRNALAREVEKIDWYSGDSKTMLAITRGQREVFVTVPECKLWGVLAVTLKN